MKHEERIELENKMMDLLKEFWDRTTEQVQKEGLKGNGNVIDEKKRDEILDIDFAINVNNAKRPIKENYIYESITSFAETIEKVRKQYRDIDENTRKLEDSIDNFFEKVYAPVNKKIREKFVVPNNKTEISQQEVTKIMRSIDTLEKDAKRKDALKRLINDVVSQLSKNISPIEKKDKIENIQYEISNKYFKQSMNLKGQIEDTITKQLNIFDELYEEHKRDYNKAKMEISAKKIENNEGKEEISAKKMENNKGKMEISAKKIENNKGKMEGMMYDYNQNEREKQELIEERVKLDKYLNQMRFYAQQDSKETSYRKIKQRQKEYTEEFLKELEADSYNLPGLQVKEITNMTNNIKKTLNKAKNGLENDNILEQIEVILKDYFVGKINNLELKNVEVLEKLKGFSNDSNVNNELDTWLSNKLIKSDAGDFANLKSSDKTDISSIEQKRKLLQLMNTNNAKNRVTIQTTMITIDDLKDKNDEQIIDMLDDKLEKSIDMLSKKKDSKVIGNTKRQPKLKERLKKILKVEKTKNVNVSKNMLKEVTMTEELNKQNGQLIKSIRSILSAKKIDKDGILQKIDGAKEITMASKEYIQNSKEGNNVETGIVKQRKKLVEDDLNKMLKQQRNKISKDKEF